MASFNRVMLLGNLTRDPQLKFLPSQTPVAEFGLAMNRKFRTQQGEDREEVTFVDCSAFGRQAEVINQYCQKGKQIFIEGRLKLDTWDDKQGGGKRSKLSVVVENFTLLGGRDGPGGGGGGGQGGGGGGYQGGQGGYQGGGQQGGGYDSGGYEDPGYESGPPQRAPANRPAPQQRGPVAQAPMQRPQQAPAPVAEPPFSDEQHFEKDDIPF
ncbi:single-stranded DNA-binding protein [Humisphaera borealis]|uniref:Single-stranded DNA-binding protein n=1 Tax=Humisphaera borealis TaxID=2807512 RepID=A0A7M2WQS7_9BACT|nr:single-stranded DNA-binding protein [Humisphaera borealis]QOV87858.1 single-stranded DNA-binding protein [Humisphaera borealis]